MFYDGCELQGQYLVLFFRVKASSIKELWWDRKPEDWSKVHSNKEILDQIHAEERRTCDGFLAQIRDRMASTLKACSVSLKV
jgi:hypothetical protein